MGLFEGNTMQLGLELVVIDCISCGIPFAAPKQWRQERINDHRRFYCPNGHEQHYTGKTEAERLRDELARTKAQLDQKSARIVDLQDEVQHQERRVNGYKGALGRVKRRVAKGTCPCCSRKFKDLEAHMKTEHPTWDPDKHAAAAAAKDA